MRKIALLLIPFILLVTSACSITLTAPEFNHERGDGDVVSQQRTVSGFDQVEFTGVGEMIITQGNEESLTIEADENIIDHIEADVIGSRLVIGIEKNFNIIGVSTIHYTLVVKDLSHLTLSGFGNVSMDELKTSHFTVDLSGAGNLTLAGLKADSLKVVISGFGNSEIGGEVKDLQVEIKGTGNFNGGELHSQTASVDVSGFGSATVWVEKDLDASISGTGNVRYYGLPQVSQQVSGLARLESLGSK